MRTAKNETIEPIEVGDVLILVDGNGKPETINAERVTPQAGYTPAGTPTTTRRCGMLLATATIRGEPKRPSGRPPEITSRC